ncbi:gypsy/ty3 retroelement polyprotein [Tanacetum coccineum]
MAISTRNSNFGNNSNEAEESLMDLVAYMSNEVAWFRSREGSSGQYSRMTKLEFPKFSGEDIKGWLFGPCYEDLMEEIKNLRQAGTIPDYQDKFEALVSRVELTKSQAISCFVAGLQQDIVLMVKMFKPKSLYDAYQLARMQETVKTLNTKRYTPILSTPKNPVNTTYANKNTITPRQR